MVSTTGARTRNNGQVRIGRNGPKQVSLESEKSKKTGKNDKHDNNTEDESVGSGEILEPKAFLKAYGENRLFVIILANCHRHKETKCYTKS